MVIEHAPIEDELGDVLDKAMSCAGLTEQALAELAAIPPGKIHDAFDYRPELTIGELARLSRVLKLNEIGVQALAAGKYPLPEIAGLPFCLYPLRTPHGVGVANAYIVADCGSDHGILFDTGSDPVALKRAWPKMIKRLDAVFITHAEAEHVGGLAEVVKYYAPVPVFCPVDAPLPGSSALAEGSRMRFGRFEVETFATPGHVESHNCYVVRVPAVPKGVPLLVSGDMIFAGSMGGAYFCSVQLKAHLARVLGTLDPQTVIAAGHGPLTTIKNERTFNPFVF